MLAFAALLWGCAKDQVLPVRTGTVQQGWWLRPVADQREYVRFVGRALWDRPDVTLEHGKSARGSTLSVRGADRETVSSALDELTHRAGGPTIPPDLQAVFAAGTDEDTVEMVYVETLRGVPLPVTTRVEQFAAKGVLPPYLQVWLPESEAAALERLTGDRTLSRVALLREDEVAALPGVNRAMHGRPFRLRGEDTPALFDKLIGVSSNDD